MLALAAAVLVVLALVLTLPYMGPIPYRARRAHDPTLENLNAHAHDSLAHERRQRHTNASGSGTSVQPADRRPAAALDDAPSDCTQLRHESLRHASTWAKNLLPPAGYCNCTFIDVGLNNGESLLQWPVNALRPPIASKALGDRSLSALRSCVEGELSTSGSSVCWFGFEANPMFSSQLRMLESHVASSRHQHVKLFTETAFNVDGSPLEFYVDTFSDGEGSSLLGNKTFIDFTPDGAARFHSDTTVRQKYKRICTRGMAAHSFLDAVTKASDHVFVKVDIEGYEFELLPHLIAQGQGHASPPSSSLPPHGICAADVLAVEWHGDMMPTATAALERRLKQQLVGCGVGTLLHWD